MNSNFWPVLINGTAGLGSILAFVLAFGWLFLPTTQELTLWQHNIEQWSFTLESIKLAGLSPWVVLGVMVAALSGTVFVLSGLTFWQSLTVVNIVLVLLTLGYAFDLIGVFVVLLMLVSITVYCFYR